MFDFDTGTFIQRGLESLGEHKVDAFCKVGDVTVYQFLSPVKHSIVGYDLLYWHPLFRPLNEQISEYKKYTSKLTGNDRFSFNWKPYPFNYDSEVFDIIHKHFVLTEMKSLKNRIDSESIQLTLINNNEITVTVDDLHYNIKDAMHVTEYRLDESLTHKLGDFKIEYKYKLMESSEYIKMSTIVDTEFTNQDDLLEQIKRDITENS